MSVPTTFGEDFPLVLERLAVTPPKDARREARAYVARCVRVIGDRRGHKFKTACRLFIEQTLPTVPAELPTLDRILGYAGFGGSDNAKLTVETLREWGRDTGAHEVKLSGEFGWHTAEDFAAMARAGELPEMPKTRRGVELFMERRLAVQTRPDDFVRERRPI